MKKSSKKPIGSIAKELAACVAAFKKYPRRRFVWCCHHEDLWEHNDGYRGRLAYIQTDKPRDELAIRYRNFRPVKGAKPSDDQRKALAQFKAEWPHNTRYRTSIFR